MTTDQQTSTRAGAQSQGQENVERLNRIVERLHLIDGLKYEGSAKFYAEKDTGLHDPAKREALTALMQEFPGDMRFLVECLNNVGKVAVELKRECDEANATAQVLSSFEGSAAQLVQCAREKGIQNFIRTTIGDSETGEVFVAEVRRKHLTPEQLAAFFAESSPIEVNRQQEGVTP